jgi:glycerophosphoryl diester phosphodiesterase
MNKTDNKRVLVFAHRGASIEYPENTMPAFKKAVDLNVDYIETDTHLTRDNKFVIIHDDSIDRVTDGNGKVMDYTMDELKKFDAGYNFTNNNGITFPFRGKGIRLMSLDELLETFPNERFNIDLKDKDYRQIKPFIQTLKKYNAHNRVIAASKHYNNLKTLRKISPNISTSFSIPEIIWIYFLYKFNLHFINIKFKGFALQIPEKRGPFNFMNKVFIDELHCRGFQMHVWTINRRENMKRLIDLGVDGIITDAPEDLLKILGR